MYNVNDYAYALRGNWIVQNTSGTTTYCSGGGYYSYSSSITQNVEVESACAIPNSITQVKVKITNPIVYFLTSGGDYQSAISMETSQSIKPYSIRPKAEYIYTMNNEEIEALVKKEMSSYIFNPKMSLDEYERKLEKTFDYCVFDRNKSEKHRQAFRSLRKRFGIAEETHIYELIENEQSAAFYAGFRYGENSTCPILFFKGFSIVSEGCYLSNCGDFSTFLIIYQGIDETEDSDSEDDNYKNMYYQSVWAFNNVVYDRIRENIYKEFYIPRVYY